MCYRNAANAALTLLQQCNIIVTLVARCRILSDAKSRNPSTRGFVIDSKRALLLLLWCDRAGCVAFKARMALQYRTEVYYLPGRTFLNSYEYSYCVDEHARLRRSCGSSMNPFGTSE